MRVSKITKKSTNHISHNSVPNPFFFITTLINYCNTYWKNQNNGILKHFNEFMIQTRTMNFYFLDNNNFICCVTVSWKKINIIAFFYIYMFDVILQGLLVSLVRAYFRTWGKGYEVSQKEKWMIERWRWCSNTKLDKKVDWVPLGFCGEVYQHQPLYLISSRDHSQRFLPLQNSDSLRLGFNEWICVVVTTTAPLRYRT